MPFFSIVFGLLLIALGLEGYTNAVGVFQVEKVHSITSLIPAFFGAFLLVCGLIAFMPASRKHMMHIAAMVGLIGAGSGLFMGIKGFMNNEAGKSLAAPKMQVTMGVLSLVFLILCVRSFIEARRRRKAAGL
jgi:hypothetical protein